MTNIITKGRPDAFIPTGHLDIDRTRQEVASNSTNENNYIYRWNILVNWTRHLSFLGADLRSFDPFQKKLQGKESNEALFKAIDEGFGSLEEIYKTFMKSREPHHVTANRREWEQRLMDWPVFHGNSEQTGYTDDPGPTKGQVAWKFPIGRAWYSRPAVEDGRVYVTSPGMTTILYCLDEETGEVIWKAHQKGHEGQYAVGRFTSSVQLLSDKVALRNVGGNFINVVVRPVPSNSVMYINKSNGKLIDKVDVGRVDYRAGYPPFDIDEKHLVFTLGAHDIHVEKPDIHPFNKVICKDTVSKETLWEFEAGELYTEPVLDGEQVFFGTFGGTFYCLNTEGDKRVAWQFDAGASINASAAFDAEHVYFGTESGVIYCLNRSNGNLRWKYKVDRKESRAFQLFSTPTVSDGKVYVGSANKFVYCLDAETGILRWKYATTDWVRSCPVAQEGKVYVASMDGKVCCLAENGAGVRLVWINQTTNHQIFADLILADDRLFVNSNDLYIHCLNTKDGNRLWHHSLIECVYQDGERIFADIDAGGADFQSSPIAAEGKVFIGCPNRFVYAIDSESGKEVWRFEVRGQVSAAPVFSHGRVFFGQQGGENTYYCVDAYSGQLLWKKQLGWTWSSSNVVDERVFVPTVNGIVYCLNAKDGTILWQYDTKRGCHPAPAVEDGVVYFGSWNGNYYAFDTKTGKLLWKYDVKGRPDSGAPLVHKGKVYLGSRYFFCLDAKTGEEIWKYPMEKGYCNMSPAIFDGRLFISIQRGIYANLLPCSKTLCLDAETGELIWEFPWGGGLTGPAVAGGKVYFASTTDPFFWCVDAEGNGDGTTNIHWKHRMGGRAEESCVAISGGKAYILITDGYLYAFE